jgi:hypothetical protein
MAGEFNSAPEQGDKAADGSTGASAVGAQTHGAAAETSAPAGQSAQSEAKAGPAKAACRARVVQPGVGGA